MKPGVAEQASRPASAAAELATTTPDRSRGFTVRRDVGARMRDGVRLSANVFLPDEGEGPHPVVLIRLPYGKDEHPTMWARGKYWARKGYTCVIQDVRGTFGSEGIWQPFVNEAADGRDTLDWVAAQPWCDGAIGMAGESYHGYTQWAVATSGHPNLKCIAPGNTTPDPYLMAYRGGALALGMLLWACVMQGPGLGDPAQFDPWHLPLDTLDAAMGRRSPDAGDILAHPSRDAFWRGLATEPTPATVSIPVLHWGGWYDVMLGGTLAGWEAMDSAGENTLRAPQRLVIGPTDHTLTATSRFGDPGSDTESGAWTFDHVQRFFDHWLRGEDDGSPASVRVFVMGAERWREGSAWPLPGTAYTRFHLRSGGDAATSGGWLSRETPDDEPPDEYDYDPARPVDTWLSEDAWEFAWTLRDREPVERRRDVAVYTSAPLEQGLEATGPVRVVLYAATSAPGTDFCAYLVDVDAEGRTHLVQEGIRRVGAPGSASLSGLGEAVRIEIDLWATSYWFAPGHRIRVEITGSDFGRYDRNLNTGRPACSEVVCLNARQRVFHDATHPSHILLPVLSPAISQSTARAGYC